MGPNVKFVSAITDAFSNKKNGGQFFSPKKDQTGGGGGGSEGGLAKDHTFSGFFFRLPSLRSKLKKVLLKKALLLVKVIRKMLRTPTP